VNMHVSYGNPETAMEMVLGYEKGLIFVCTISEPSFFEPMNSRIYYSSHLEPFIPIRVFMSQ
jgi:hypothetical protein